MRVLRIQFFMLIIVTASGLAQVRRGALPGDSRPITVDGRERSYRVVVPSGKEPMPLVLVLHGGGAGESAAAHLVRATGFSGLAMKEGFIVAYPVGVGGNWNDGRGVEFIRAQKENIDDVKFLRQVVEDIAKRHPVDRSRVFATGISNGAFMSHRLAAEASDLVAGIAPVVGGMSPAIGGAFKPEHPVSLFVIQGDSDPITPYGGGGVGFKGRRERGRLMATEQTVAKYVERNRIHGEPTVTTLPDPEPGDGTTTEARIYTPGNGGKGARVQLYVVRGGGHTWPGAVKTLPEKLVGKTARDFDATEAIWTFFKSCPPRKRD